MDARRPIRVLPPQVANKIAAGEVVERPAAVLKELMENAIDAEATQIDVDVGGGGRKLVAVRDNGWGMSRDDALLAVERHATSKIRDVDDLERIATLGFRGEALAASAAVSRFRLVTCPRGEVGGTELLISGGTVQDVREVGVAPGTTVEVRDLFFNVPARRKFLRTQATELGHLRAAFLVQALSHPAIGMSLRVDGADVYRLAGAAALEDRLRELFGRECLATLARVDASADAVRVRGYAGRPPSSRSDRGEQYVFVNGRAASAPLLGFAIQEAYRSLLPAGRHPTLFLLLETDPALVDVNVHPTKREVRFRHPGEVRDAVIAALRQALGAGGAGLPAGPAAEADAPAPALASAQARLQIEDLPAARAFRYPRLPVADAAALRAEPAAPAAEAAPGSAAPLPAAPAAPWAWCRVVGVIGNLYVVLETEDGYVLMDPHAAHERVLFERFMGDVLRGRVEAQALLLPETVELSPKDAARVRGHLELLRAMGFGLAEFGGDAFVVDALPAYLAGAPPRQMLPDVAQSLEAAGRRGGEERWREEAVAQAACKAAVKARERLTLEAIERLVVDLARAQMPYTCPHGRPTLIYTSFRDLNRKFGRE